MTLSKVFSQMTGQIVGTVSTIACGADTAGSLAGHSWKFWLANESGTLQGYWVWYTVTGYTSNNPVTGAFKGINVTIAGGSTAAQVFAATKAALLASGISPGLATVTGASPNVIISCRWPFVCTATADVDTGWVFTATNAGSATVATNMNLNASGAGGMDWVIRPWRGPISLTPIYLRQLVISIADSAFTDGTTFGAVVGLTNGISIYVCDAYANIFATIASAIKNNAALISLGKWANALGTKNWFVAIDLVAAYGGELPIDGSLGQDLRFHTADDLTGLDVFNCYVTGHYTSTL
jgi:hypothetical protein